MTSLTILPYRDAHTYNLTTCSMDHICTECAEEYETEFDGERAVRFWDSDGALVAMMTFSEMETEGFFKTTYRVEEIIVNVCGRTSLSTIIKQLCTYVTELDDSIGTFDFECPVDYALSLLLQEFCEFHTYTPSDDMMYFSYEAK